MFCFFLFCARESSKVMVCSWYHISDPSFSSSSQPFFWNSLMSGLFLLLPPLPSPSLLLPLPLFPPSTFSILNLWLESLARCVHRRSPSSIFPFPLSTYTPLGILWCSSPHHVHIFPTPNFLRGAHFSSPFLKIILKRNKKETSKCSCCHILDPCFSFFYLLLHPSFGNFMILCISPHPSPLPLSELDNTNEKISTSTLLFCSHPFLFSLSLRYFPSFLSQKLNLPFFLFLTK